MLDPKIWNPARLRYPPPLAARPAARGLAKRGGPPPGPPRSWVLGPGSDIGKCVILRVWCLGKVIHRRIFPCLVDCISPI